MTPSLTELARTSAEQSSANRGRPDFEPFDLSTVDQYVKQHPTTAVGGTAVALRYAPGDPDDEGWDAGTPMLILDDAFVISDEDDFAGTAIFEKAPDGSGDDVKVVNTDDEATDVVEGTGVTFDGHLYKGSPADGFAGRIALKLTGRAGRRAARSLDGNGAPYLDAELQENGSVKSNGGLIELPPDDSDEDARISRHTFLRPDAEGEQVIVQLRRAKDVHEDYDGRGYWATVTIGDGDDMFVAEPIEGDVPEDVRSTQWIEYHWPAEASGSN